jgi:TM2 domain-containing membrane protein YozV
MRRMVDPEASTRSTTSRPERSLATAYLVWFLVGIFGGHRFYLGDRLGGTRYLVALGCGVGLPIVGLAIALLSGDVLGVTVGLVAWVAGLVVLLGVLCMAIVDAFRLPGLTRRANDRVVGQRPMEELPTTRIKPPGTTEPAAPEPAATEPAAPEPAVTELTAREIGTDR